MTLCEVLPCAAPGICLFFAVVRTTFVMSCIFSLYVAWWVRGIVRGFLNWREILLQ